MRKKMNKQKPHWFCKNINWTLLRTTTLSSGTDCSRTKVNLNKILTKGKRYAGQCQKMCGITSSRKISRFEWRFYPLAFCDLSLRFLSFCSHFLPIPLIFIYIFASIFDILMLILMHLLCLIYSNFTKNYLQIYFLTKSLTKIKKPTPKKTVNGSLNAYRVIQTLKNLFSHFAICFKFNTIMK
jgi:hypothetical protein